MIPKWLDRLLAPAGWAMVDSFWWITGVAVALALMLRLAREATPERRYTLAGLAVLGAPVAFLMALRGGDGASMTAGMPIPLGALPAAIGMASFDGTDWARPLAVFWLCGVCLLSLRTVGGWVYLRLLIRRAAPMDWPVLAELRTRMGVGRQVQLRASRRADSPFTAGWQRPVIVVPLATLAGLPADQFEAVLLHELAHIRRHDYLAEWALQTIETVFFYHPGVWWMTAMMRKERERSCDDMAIRSGVERGCYAKALLRLEEMRVPALANGWTGTDLRGRVARVLGQPSRTAAWPAVAIVVLAMLAPFAVAQVPKPYSLWLNEDVTYIIQPQERKAFEALRTDPERERFIEQFWERRDPTPTTPYENEAKEEHYRRISWANDRCKEAGSTKPGWATEKGRTYIVFGPPDEIEVHPAENNEKWYYKLIPGVGSNVYFEFGSRRRPR